MAFAKLINSTGGRVLRIVAGGALIGAGAALGDGAGVALIAVGGVPLAAGLLDLCLLAPILSVPWRGSKIRAMR